MLNQICPKLPMRDKTVTRDFYINLLGFQDIGAVDYPEYLILQKDQIEIHFFLFKELNPFENYGQVYIRVLAIEELYNNAISQSLPMPALGKLEVKPWGQKEFSLLDPDHNLLTFGQSYS